MKDVSSVFLFSSSLFSNYHVIKLVKFHESMSWELQLFIGNPA